MGLERADKAVLLEVAGPQLEDEGAHLGERLALEVAQLAELLERRVASRSMSSSTERRDQGHREQRLGDRIVELAGEVRPLLAGRQLARLAAQLALEADLVGSRRASRPGSR